MGDFRKEIFTQPSPKATKRESIQLFCVAAIGCYFCYSLQDFMGVTNFVASALTGFAGSLLPHSHWYNQKKVAAALYCGSFAAMTDLFFLESFPYIFMLSSLAGLFYIALSPYARGFGGKLGTIGFVAALTFLGLRWML